MKNILVDGKMQAIDGEHEFELGFCYNSIKNWKRFYLKKNSKYPATIKLRCFFSPPDPVFWKYYLELSINGKMHEQIRIRQEAYDVLGRDLPMDEYIGVSFTILAQFTPQKKQ